MAQQLVDELNFARREPVIYATMISENYSGRYSKMDINETSSFLKYVTSCTNKLFLDNELSNAAIKWVEQQGRTTSTGHGDFRRRMNVLNKTEIAENISYGHTNIRDIVVAWIIDEKIESKGHRNNIFNCNFENVGVGIGPHKSYRLMVDIILST